MFGNTVRCCNHIKHVTGTPFEMSYNFKSVVAGFGYQKAFYAMDKKGCSKDTPQTKGRQVEDWPTHDPPPPMWRPECPRDPSPVTDPYRIKVPDVVVPQLKGSPAQESGSRDALFGSCVTLGLGPALAPAGDMLSPPDVPEYWREEPGNRLESPHEIFPKLGYHGRNKLKYAFHEPWRPLDRISLLNQAEKDEGQSTKEIEAGDTIEKENV